MLKPYRKVFLVATVIFVLLSVTAGAGWLRGLDMMTLRSAQRPASVMLDVFSEAFSLAGGVFLSTGLVVGLVMVLYLRGREALAVRLAVAFATASLVEVTFKLYLPVPPLPLEYLRSSGEELIIRFPNPYPSGHMMRSLFLAGSVILLRPTRPVYIAAGVFLAAMAATRVYLGVHWASDVVGGALLGIAALAWAFGREDRKSTFSVFRSRERIG